MISKTIILFLLIFPLTSVFGQNRRDSLIVFIGEKIEVKELPLEIKKWDDIEIDGKDTIPITHISRSMDGRFFAKYKILQLLHGFYKQDTIEFVAYDHYGVPGFSKYQTVLLFVSYYNGKLIHEKYQFFDLYMTKKGKWASPSSSYHYTYYKDSTTVKPEKIRFKNDVSYPIGKLTNEDINKWFPKPYYKIKNGRAIAVYGNYVDDLFKLERQTTLKARGIY